MISAKFKVDTRGLDMIERQVRDKSRRVVVDVAEHILADAVSTMQTPYPPSSKRGEPPHMRKGWAGGLVSTGRIVAQDESGRFSSGNKIGSTVVFQKKYATFLEDEDVLDRQFLTPALDRAEGAGLLRDYAVRHKLLGG